MKTTEKKSTNDLRQSLKEIIQTEIEKLPEVLNTLQPKERLNFLCRLMPFVFPKIESINSDENDIWN